MKKRAICKSFHGEVLIEDNGTRDITREHSIGTRQESDVNARIRHTSGTNRQPNVPDTPDSTTTTTKVDF